MNADSKSSALTYVRENRMLMAGMVLVALLVLFSLLGRLLVDVNEATPLSGPSSLPPCREYPFGTDDVGRNLLAVMVRGVVLTGWVGLVAGVVGLGLGTVLGLLAGYVGGRVDACIRAATDTVLTVPGLLVLISIASTIREEIDLTMMALVVASLSWMWPARTIRAKVLSLRERTFVQMARLNGMNWAEIIALEIFPNLLPYLAASFVNAMSSAILATIYLEALGLGPQNEPTVGMTLYWAITFGALIRGMWWWWAIPIVFLVMLFLGLFLLAAGLDELANPKQRKAV